jgi:hypothetical protein
MSDEAPDNEQGGQFDTGGFFDFFGGMVGDISGAIGMSNQDAATYGGDTYYTSPPSSSGGSIIDGVSNETLMLAVAGAAAAYILLK